MKKNKGFTLIELLAVIVILAIILVIAVPQILGVIQSTKKDSLRMSVKMFASSIEKDYVLSQASDSPDSLVSTPTDCPPSADFTQGECTYTLELDERTGAPVATVTIVGIGKFAGLTASGTRAGTVEVIPTPTPSS